MTEKDFSCLSDQEFESVLENLELHPDEELISQVNPWRRAMNRILWGLGLCTITLNFFQLQFILPAIGILLTVLGYRALRRENGWFGFAYGLSLVRAVWLLVSLGMDATVWAASFDASESALVLTYGMLMVSWLNILCLRNGLKAVQLKAGLEPRVGSATALTVWYTIMTVLAVIRVESILVWLLLLSYVCILRGLYKCSKLLDEAGYVITPAPVRISDRAVKYGYWALILALFVLGYSCFRHYPMDWQPVEAVTTEKTEEIREELISLGFPETVLNDLTEEEILACEGADRILVQSRDYDMVQGRGIGTMEEIIDGKVALITADEGTAHLRTTYVGVQFTEERERWQIIQHFEWLQPLPFRGTEAIQLWPADHSQGWSNTGEFTGRVLYDVDGISYTAPYHFLGKASYANDPWLASMFGNSSRTDVFAAFSLPDAGSRQRGYVSYELLEMQDGWIVDCWFNYTHQYGQFQFPVRTAMEDIMAGFGSHKNCFVEIQTALQFSTHGEEPKLLD